MVIVQPASRDKVRVCDIFSSDRFCLIKLRSLIICSVAKHVLAPRLTAEGPAHLVSMEEGTITKKSTPFQLYSTVVCSGYVVISDNNIAFEV